MSDGSLLRAMRFAWLSTVRQPARTALGILGVAAVGALLFDMLLLSRGLVLSFRDLLDRGGFDVRVLASDAPPFAGPEIADAAAVSAGIQALPEVADVLRIRLRDVEPAIDGGPLAEAAGGREIQFIGADPSARPMWTLLRGRDLAASSGPAADDPAIVVNNTLARELQLSPGSRLALRGRCSGGASAIPPVVFAVVGVVEFPFDDPRAATVGGTLADIPRLCGEEAVEAADMLLVRSQPGRAAAATADAIRAASPGLHVVTNDDLIERFTRVEFSYFRQISIVLATVTLFFGFLLIAVLLTVSVNQRLGEIAVLRAVGLSRPRILAGVLFESALLVGAGGLLAIPLGFALSVWLEGILASMPGVPADLRFFVFEPRALALHLALLVAAAVAAAVYPMRIVATLPIAETLRREVVS